jgi:glycosyltransferase involved in cell wall biosynthesis
MKIAFLGPAYPLRGGIAHFATLLAIEMQKKNQVKLFSFARQYPTFLFPGKEQKEIGESKPDLEIESILIPYNPFTWKKNLKAIFAFKPQILIISYWIPFFAPCFGWLAGKLKKQNISVFYLIHNLTFHERWLMAETLTRFALKKADALISLSDSVYHELKQKYPASKIIRGFHPVYNCYDYNAFTPQTAKKKLRLEEKRVLLFFGFIKPYKGVDLLLRSMPSIIQKLPDTHLLICGEVYGKVKPYNDMIKELKLEDKISFYDRFIANDEIEMFFKAADVLVLPYLSATQSGVLQIAAHFGLGAVCTPVGSLSEMIGENGIVAKAVSESAFAEAIIEYFALDGNHLRQNILTENYRYSWENLAQLITA